jgi:hypothetical protein
MNCVEFGVDRSRGFGSVRGQYWPIAIDRPTCPNNVASVSMPLPDDRSMKLMSYWMDLRNDCPYVWLWQLILENRACLAAYLSPKVVNVSPIGSCPQVDGVGCKEYSFLFNLFLSIPYCLQYEEAGCMELIQVKTKCWTALYRQAIGSGMWTGRCTNYWAVVWEGFWKYKSHGLAITVSPSVLLTWAFVWVMSCGLI